MVKRMNVTAVERKAVRELNAHYDRVKQLRFAGRHVEATNLTCPNCGGPKESPKAKYCTSCAREINS